MTQTTLTLHLKLNDLTDSTPVGAKLERYIEGLHPTILVASECCLASTQPRDAHHVFAGVFYVVYLIQASAGPNKAVMVLRPKPSKPVCLRALPAHKPILLDALK